MWGKVTRTVLLGGLLIGAPAPAQAAEVDPTRVLVRFDADVDRGEARDVAEQHDVSLGKRLAGTRFTVVRTDGRSPRTVERVLEREGEVANVEPNYIRKAFAVPNDPLIAKGRQPWLETTRLYE